MAERLKVFSGIQYGMGGGIRVWRKCILATTSQKRAAEILKTSVSNIRNFWGSSTAHTKVNRVALAHPHKPLYLHEGQYVFAKDLPKIRAIRPGVSGQYKWATCPHCGKRFEVETAKKGGPMQGTFDRHEASCGREREARPKDHGARGSKKVPRQRKAGSRGR